MSEYVMNHIGEQLDEAIDMVLNNYIKPEGDSPEITTNGLHPVREYENAIVNVPIPKFETEEIVITPTEAQQTRVPQDTDGFSKVTVEPIPPLYVGSAVPKKDSAVYTPQKGSQIVISSGQYLNGDQVINSIPNNYIDTSNATAGIYDIYNGKTAYVNGELVTGGLTAVTAPLTGSSPGCTSTLLRLACPFKPTHITALYLASSYSANKVHAITAWLNGYYCATSLGAASSGKYALYRSQFKIAETNNYFYWDGTYVYLAAPSSSYPFDTGSGHTYRIFAFK